MAATLPQDTHPKIVALSARGLTVPEIAAEVGCGENAVRTALREHEIRTLRDRVGPMLTVPEIAALGLHELCRFLPEMSADEKADLKARIGSIGLRPEVPIVVWRGQVIDGRHRLAISRELGVELRPEHFRVFVGSEEEAFDLVLALNLDRRHLTSGQRAALAVKVKQRLEARGVKGARAEAAHALHVSAGYVQAAEQLAERAPEVAAEVAAGALTLKAGREKAGVGSRRPAAPKGADRAGPEILVDRRSAANPTRVEDVLEEYEERRAMADADSDEEWVESLPLFAKLAGKKRDLFVRAATNWRESTAARREWAAAVAGMMSGNREPDPWLGRHVRALSCGDPSDWSLCPRDEGGCGGTGEGFAFGGKKAPRCEKCWGAGFLVA